jgi:predicted RND superfamily exporter protein
MMEKIFKKPLPIIILIAVITCIFAAFLPKAELDNNNLRFVPEDDPALNVSRWIDSTFGSSLFILIGLQREYGTVFDRDFLNRVRDYIEKVSVIQTVKDVVSIVSADYITSTDGAIVVEKLVSDNFSGTAQEIAELKTRLLSWDLYEHALVSDDFSSTQILIPLTIKSEDAGSPEVDESFLAIRNLAHEMFDDISLVYVTGMPVISASINEAVSDDLRLLVPLVIVVVLVVLFFSFRAFTPVVLPLLTVLIAVIWSVGAMPIFGVKLSVVSTVMPVILVAVGSAYGIHVVTHYLHDRGKNELSREEHSKIVFDVMRVIVKPVFLAALTTFVSFFSLFFSPVVPIKEFGIFTAFGVFASFIVAVTIIPSLLIIRGPKKIKERDQAKDTLSSSLASTLVAITQKRKTVIFISVCFLIVSVFGLMKIKADNALVEYFKDDTDIHKSDRFIREHFGGSKVISVVMQADSDEIILRPDTLSALDSMGIYLETIPNVGKVMGFTDLVKRINQVFNVNADPAGLTRTDDTSSAFDDFGFGNFFDDDDFSEPSEVTGIDAEQDSVFSQQEFFAMLDKAASVSRNMSADDLVRGLKRQVNYKGEAYYEIPADPLRYGKETGQDLQKLISNYLVLLSGSISDYANDPLQPTAIKSTVQLRTIGMEDSQKIFDKIERYLKIHAPDDVTVTVGGTTMVEGSLNKLIVQSQLISVLISIICVFIIVSASNRSLIAGLIGIAPLSISVLINFAVMGFAGINLNLGTSMVASVSVGIGIDYAIHYLEAFKREYRNSEITGNDFLWRSFNSSGRAIIINAVSVGAGFAVLLFSKFNMLIDLGLLIAITMFTSALVSITVLPVLLVLLKPKFITKGYN